MSRKPPLAPKSGLSERLDKIRVELMQFCERSWAQMNEDRDLQLLRFRDLDRRSTAPVVIAQGYVLLAKKIFDHELLSIMIRRLREEGLPHIAKGLEKEASTRTTSSRRR
jgi:hypothetical protein